MVAEVETKYKALDGEKNPLENKIVDVKLIETKGSSWLGPGHDGEFQFSGALNGFCIPTTASGKMYKKVLSQEEVNFFERVLQLEKGEMSFYVGRNDFWSKQLYVKFDKNGTTLDLSKPLDYLKYIVLKNDKRIANSPEEMNWSPHYRFYMVSRDEEIKNTFNKSQKKRMAYKEFGKIENSVTELQNILTIYGKKTDNSDLQWLNAEVDKIIEKDLDGFIRIIKDEDRDLKVLIEKAISCKSLLRPSRTTYKLPGGDLIGSSLNETVEWFKDPENSEAVMKIKAQIEATK